MRTLRAIVIAIMAGFAGILVGFVVYMMGGAPEGAENWSNWLYIPCYIIPIGSVILGAMWGWRTGEEYGIGAMTKDSQ